MVSPSAQCPVRSLACSYIGCLAGVNLWDVVVYFSLTCAANILYIYCVGGQKMSQALRAMRKMKDRLKKSLAGCTAETRG